MNECPQCGQDTIEYVGESYDEEEHLGSLYECSNCDFRFTITPEEQAYHDGQRDE